MVTSELRLSYYSAPKQREVMRLLEKGQIKMHEHSDGLYSFIEQYSDAYPHAGEGVLILVHLCLSSRSTLIIEEDQCIVRDIATFFNIPTIQVKEFYQQNVKNQQYQDFLIGCYNG